MTSEELTNPALEMDALVWRLFHDEGEIRVLPQTPPGRRCRCDPVHIRQVVGQFSAEEHAEMADSDGIIRINCGFCAKSFPIEASEL